jgi:4-hydroxybenzoate polyprenyltransferase
MADVGVWLKLTRIDKYLPVIILVFPLVFLISPKNLFSIKTVLLFFANLFLTVFGYTFNDVEDAEDDYHDLEKRNRNPIASGELTKRQGYLFCFIVLSSGLFLLFFINSFIFSLGLFFSLGAFFYSWKPVRLKSIPIIDLITHVLFLGVIQFFITYLSFRPFDLFVVPFLMIIM